MDTSSWVHFPDVAQEWHGPAGDCHPGQLET